MAIKINYQLMILVPSLTCTGEWWNTAIMHNQTMMTYLLQRARYTAWSNSCICSTAWCRIFRAYPAIPEHSIWLPSTTSLWRRLWAAAHCTAKTLDLLLLAQQRGWSVPEVTGWLAGLSIKKFEPWCGIIRAGWSLPYLVSQQQGRSPALRPVQSNPVALIHCPGCFLYLSPTFLACMSSACDSESASSLFLRLCQVCSAVLKL